MDGAYRGDNVVNYLAVFLSPLPAASILIVVTKFDPIADMIHICVAWNKTLMAPR